MLADAYWLAFGDIHDDLSRLEEIPELDGAEGVIVTGDITLAGGVTQARRVLEAIAARVPRLLAQIGNMDKSEVTGWLEERGWNLHVRGKILCPGVMIIGVGGSPFTPFGTPSEFSEAQLAKWLEKAHAEAREALDDAADEETRLVLISHAPPYNSGCDRLHSGAPAGSTAVRDFIEKYQPDLCLCGHIHESRAEERLGRTLVINPGALSAGGYVVLYPGNNGRELRAERRHLP